MISLSFLLARRYLVNPAEKTISIMAKICFLGIFISTFALALIISIMNGFEKITHATLQGFHADVILQSHGENLNVDAINTVINTEFHEVESLSPSDQQYVIIHPNDDTIIHVALLKALDPQREIFTSKLESTIIKTVDGSNSLIKTLTDNQVLIGDKFALLFNLQIGDYITMHYVADNQTHAHKLNLNTKQARIGGIFKTGLEEYDSNLILCTFDFMQLLFPDSDVSTISLKIKPYVDIQMLIKKLRSRFDLDVYSWKDLYPALVSALLLEKYAMFFILSLIVLIASMSIISLLFMNIIQKQRDIAILQAMGIQQIPITLIFIIMGMSISVCASSLGLLAAYCVGIFLDRYPCITLPDTYYATHLPISLDANMFLIIFALSIGLGLIISWIGSRKTNTITIATILKQKI